MSVTVVGGGAWGTALAAAARWAGQDVRLLLRDPAIAASITQSRANPKYLPGIVLPDGILATTDPSLAFERADTILMVVPAQTLRAVLKTYGPVMPEEAPLVLCSKGIERESGDFASAVAASVMPRHAIAVLSGPSFANDVAGGLPTAVTLAARNDGLAERLSTELSGPSLRIYASADVVGVEAGGALKNVLAIAAGAVAGRGLGASAVAAIVTRGFVELRRLGEALGAQPETLMGLSGLGDLVLTASSAQSRNFAYGVALGKGTPLDELKLAEGVYSAGIAATLARERGIEAPIIETVAAVLESRLSLDAAIASLLARPLRREDRID